VSEYLKFTYENAGSELTPFAGLVKLNACRRKLLDLQLIGVDRKGVSFGNLSVRDGATNSFYITGSATGAVPELKPADCARVVSYNFEENWVRYEGTAIPSSESMTHAAVYASDVKVGAVIHCHDSQLWAALLNHAPTTSKAVEYGTPEMAHEVMHLFKSTDVQHGKIFVMGGHGGGIVAFGRDLEEAFAVLIHERQRRI